MDDRGGMSMTIEMERDAAAAGERTRAGRERPKPSRSVRWRVAVRVAQRQVRRTWVSSLLIMTLIALPIGGMAGVAVLVHSTMSTAPERVAVELGRMAGWVAPMGVPGEGFWQSPAHPWENGHGDGRDSPEGEILADPLSALPEGTRVIEVSSGRERVRTETGLAAIRAYGGEIWDPRFSGRFDIREGRAASASDEVMVTAATLERIGEPLGGSIVLADSGESYTIVGTVDIAELPDSESAVAFTDGGRFEEARWYLPDLDLDWSAIQSLNDEGIGVYARSVVLDPPPFRLPDGSEPFSEGGQETQSLLALAGTLAAGGAAAGYMVVMLAGAAFAVSARRQQRALAIAASVGADGRDLRRTVVLQGTVLGLVAGVVGLAAGVGLAALTMLLTTDGSAVQYWGFHVPWLLLIGILVFAVVVGTASALLPARAVGRTDTISALRGARRPQRVAAARPLWGSLLILIGAGITVLCGTAAAAVAVDATLAWDSPLRWLPIVGIIGGPILAQIGIIISGRWLLWLTSRALSTFGVAARIASRDAVANGARTVPAFAAIGATVFVGVFAVGVGMMSNGQTMRSHAYSAPVGTAIADVYSMSDDVVSEEIAERTTREVASALASAGATATATVGMQQRRWADDPADLPQSAIRAVASMPDEHLIRQEGGEGWSGSARIGDPENNLVVVDSEDITTVTGLVLSPEQERRYRAGAALVADPRLVTGGDVTIAAWTERHWNEGRAPNNVTEPSAEFRPAEPVWTETLDALSVPAPNQGVSVAIAPSVADELGLETVAKLVYATLPEGAEIAAGDRLYALADSMTTTEHGVSMWIETGPADPVSWLVPLLAAVAVLVVGASSVALGLARFERRPDDATLSAVGGTPGLRRRICLWQGLVIAGFGTLAGAVAGVLPPIGFWLQSQTSYSGPMDLSDIPWWLLATLTVVLPLGIALMNWLVPPRVPDLARRNVIA